MPQKKKSAVRSSKPLDASPKPNNIDKLMKKEQSRRDRERKIKLQAQQEKIDKKIKQRQANVDSHFRKRAASHERALIKRHGLQTRRNPTKPKHV